MRIALFLHTLGGGGVERSTIRLAQHFRDVGHDVDILAFSGGGNMRPDADKVARVFDFRAPWWGRRLLEYLRYLWASDPDVVIAATRGPNLVSSLANGLLSRRRTVILSEREADRFLHEPQAKFKTAVLQWLMLFAYRRADAIVAVSRGLARQLGEIPRMRASRIHTIYNPVWSPALEHAVSEAAIGRHEVPTVVSVGRLVAEKDYSTLLHAFAEVRRHRPSRLVILGDGELRPELEQLVRDLSLVDDVSLPGYAADPIGYIVGSHVFALSSVSEAFGNVIVEALACGTPVVCTDCPFGPAEILEGGRYGRLVRPGDAQGLSAAILDQLDHPLPKADLQARARAFSVEAAANAYLELATTLMTATKARL